MNGNNILGHCNKKDIIKLEQNITGKKISVTEDFDFECNAQTFGHKPDKLMTK